MSAEAQLAAIADATAALARAGVPHWLYGGWSEDFHAGVVQREHDHSDLVVWSHDVGDARAALAESGFTGEGRGLERDGVALDLCIVETDLAGSVLFADGGAEWPPGALGAEQRTLEGVTARVVSAEAAAWRP